MCRLVQQAVARVLVMLCNITTMLRRQRTQLQEISSYLGPIANKVVVDSGELDDFRIVAAEPTDKSLNGIVEIEDHAACMGIANHALQPKERCDAHPAA